jgi:hypothetical protein
MSNWFRFGLKDLLYLFIISARALVCVKEAAVQQCRHAMLLNYYDALKQDYYFYIHATELLCDSETCKLIRETSVAERNEE